jgi:hypothetical protein
LAEVTQQIHSFRASGVMAAQRPFAAASDSMALRKSGGSLCIALVVKLVTRTLLPPEVMTSCRALRSSQSVRHVVKDVGHCVRDDRRLQTVAPEQSPCDKAKRRRSGENVCNHFGR